MILPDSQLKEAYDKFLKIKEKSLKQKRMGSQKTEGITNKPSSGGLKVKYKHNT